MRCAPNNKQRNKRRIARRLAKRQSLPPHPVQVGKHQKVIRFTKS
jgi:hypothetical protein